MLEINRNGEKKSRKDKKMGKAVNSTGLVSFSLTVIYTMVYILTILQSSEKLFPKSMTFVVFPSRYGIFFV